MSKDYLPGGDTEFSAWFDRFTTYADEHTAALGLLPADLVPVDGAHDTWGVSYARHMVAQAAAKGATMTKNNDRQDAEGKIRQLVEKLRANPNLTDEQKTALGIETPEPQPVPVPSATVPEGSVDFSTRLRHTLKYWDVNGSKSARSIPRGTSGCEVWVTIGAESKDPNDYVLANIGEKPSCSVPHRAENAGKTAYYMLRWRFKNGSTGDWSETLSATIAA